MFVGGRLGLGARGGLPVLAAVPAMEIDGVVERLARAHAAGQDLVAVGREIAESRGEDEAAPSRAEGVA